MLRKPLIEFTKAGLYCPAGDFYIDPVRAVKRAVITHGHSDHARSGHEQYLCHTDSVAILRLRLGRKISVQGIPYDEKIRYNGVEISLHPAGHIIGSAMVRVAFRDEIWVISGDYKTTPDGLTVPWQPVKCHHFITESTFGMPVFRFPPASEILADIKIWQEENRKSGRTSIITGYSLGKAQRLVKSLHEMGIPLYLHDSIYEMNETLRAAGQPIPYAPRVHPDIPAASLSEAILLMAPSAQAQTWMEQLSPVSSAMASGWMALERRRNGGFGFPMSDHCDWDELHTAVRETAAEQIYVTHGYSKIFAKWLCEKGYQASTVEGNSYESLEEIEE